MYEMPMICRRCGELVIAWPQGWDLLIVPPHPDRLLPAEKCDLSGVVYQRREITSR